MELEGLRSKLLGLSGVPLEDEHLLQLLVDFVSGGGGVQLEIDDGTRFRLIRRDGRFQLTKEPMRARASTVPPRR